MFLISLKYDRGKEHRCAVIVIIILITNLITSTPHALESRDTLVDVMDKEWVITDEAIVTNKTIILSGDLIVQKGGSLILKNVTLIMNCTENGTYHIEVQEGGSLFFFDYDSDPKTKDDSTNITSKIQDGEHRYYIWVKKGATFKMNNSEIHECGFYTDYYDFKVKGINIEADGCVLSNSLFSENMDAIHLNNSNYTYISNCNFYKNSAGIVAIDSNYMSIRDSRFTDSSRGIYTYGSRFNLILNCNFNNNTLPTELLDFEDSQIINNTIEDNYFGIYHGGMDGCVYKNNTMINNTYDACFMGGGHKIEPDIDPSNTIDGAPIYWLVNQNGIEISPNTGFNKVGHLAIIDSTNISIKNLSFKNKGTGIFFKNSKFCRIQNLEFSNNIDGIQIFNSSNIIVNNSIFKNGSDAIYSSGSKNNIIQNCQFSDLHFGVRLIKSDNNLIQNCEFTDIEEGFNLASSHNNTIEYCQLSKYNISFKARTANDNWIQQCKMTDGNTGIYLMGNCERNIIRYNEITTHRECGINIVVGRNWFNQIYYNNFFFNSFNAIDGSPPNQWDDGSGGGNFWDDYDGEDNGADGRPAGDGVGDTELPYLEIDNYPFMKENGWENYVPVDANNDGIADAIDPDDDNEDDSGSESGFQER